MRQRCWPFLVALHLTTLVDAGSSVQGCAVDAQAAEEDAFGKVCLLQRAPLSRGDGAAFGVPAPGRSSAGMASVLSQLEAEHLLLQQRAGGADDWMRRQVAMPQMLGGPQAPLHARLQQASAPAALSLPVADSGLAFSAAAGAGMSLMRAVDATSDPLAGPALVFEGAAAQPMGAVDGTRPQAAAVSPFTTLEDHQERRPTLTLVQRTGGQQSAATLRQEREHLPAHVVGSKRAGSPLMAALLVIPVVTAMLLLGCGGAAAYRVYVVKPAGPQELPPQGPSKGVPRAAGASAGVGRRDLVAGFMDCLFGNAAYVR
eukprot:TRINITY_DN47190_c0_g2_i2.p1 TRINITY_DN47190_c0_g2~~TRINITY_DN47190_c0_g2_i2.p1  ORF type:complete len:315 (-),score=57.13 TRINITY_DN47190_c0_g2_i2:269-1213(-)